VALSARRTDLATGKVQRLAMRAAQSRPTARDAPTAGRDGARSLARGGAGLVRLDPEAGLARANGAGLACAA
jgi:hypothetical protein